MNRVCNELCKNKIIKSVSHLAKLESNTAPVVNLSCYQSQLNDEVYIRTSRSCKSDNCCIADEYLQKYQQDFTFRISESNIGMASL